MSEKYIGSQQHFEDCINEDYDRKKQYEKDMQKQYEKDYYTDMQKQYEKDMQEQLQSDFGSLSDSR